MSKLEEELLEKIIEGGLPQPAREYRFHPVRRWRIDFFWEQERVGCEVEGGVFVRGRHTRGAGQQADIEKYNEIVLADIRLIRATNKHIRNGWAIEWLRKALCLSAGTRPSDGPSGD